MDSIKKKGIFAVIAVFGIIFAIFIGIAVGNQTDVKRAITEEKNLENESNKLIILPTAREVDRRLFHKEGHASVNLRYATNKTYQEIRSYYIDEAKRNGWKFSDEENLTIWGKEFGGKEITFKKNNYILTITYWGKKVTDNLTYDISIVWTFF